MPKISIYNNNNDKNHYDNRNSDPRTWGWNYPTLVKTLDKDYVLGVDAKSQDDGFIIYGIFKNTNSKLLNEKDVVAAIEMQEMPGAYVNIPQLKKVAIEHNVATVEEHRSKGFIRTLYEWIMDKYKILFSDSELFTNSDKDSQTLGIWKYFLPKLGTMLNYNTKTKEYTQFDPSAETEEVRFVSVKDKQVAETMLESFKKWMKTGVAGAALTGLLSLPMMGATNKSDKSDYRDYPIAPPPMNEPVSKEYLAGKSPLAKPDPVQELPKEKPLYINVNIIADIESGGNTKQGRNGSGATGICQIKKPAWDETIKDLYGKNGTSKYPYYKYATNAYVNKKVAEHYYNVILRKHLEAFDIPVTKETLIASYNWGSKNVKRAISRYGDYWLRNAPRETREYIDSYKNLEKIM